MPPGVLYISATSMRFRGGKRRPELTFMMGIMMGKSYILM